MALDLLFQEEEMSTFCYVNAAETQYQDLLLNFRNVEKAPIPVAVRSKVWVFGRSLTGIVVSNPTGGMDVCLL
jgi:hypothetical protein